MTNPIAIITCIVGVIGCVVGVCTFIAAMISRAKQDGMLIAKVDQCVKGIDEIKADMKEKNLAIDKTIDLHSQEITALQGEVNTLKMLYEQIKNKG